MERGEGVDILEVDKGMGGVQLWPVTEVVAASQRAVDGGHGH